MSKTLDAIPGR